MMIWNVIYYSSLYLIVNLSNSSKSMPNEIDCELFKVFIQLCPIILLCPLGSAPSAYSTSSASTTKEEI